MKRITFIALTGLMLGSFCLLNAQSTHQIEQKKPVLIADTKPVGKGSAIESLINGYGTITTAIGDLSDKQEGRIIRLESCRDKRMTKLDAKISSQNQTIKAEAGNMTEKQIKKLEKSILNLLIERQQLTAKYKKRILRLLSPAQKERLGLE